MISLIKSVTMSVQLIFPEFYKATLKVHPSIPMPLPTHNNAEQHLQTRKSREAFEPATLVFKRDVKLCASGTFPFYV
jgi:hypothetical protein